MAIGYNVGYENLCITVYDIRSLWENSNAHSVRQYSPG